MKKLILMILISFNVSQAKTFCCCTQLIDRLITTVETKLTIVINDDTSALDKLIESTDTTNEEYLADLVEKLKSDKLKSEDKLKKFQLKDLEHLYQACAKAEGLKYFTQLENEKTIMDIIDKKVNSLNFIELATRYEQNINIIDKIKDNEKNLKKLMNQLTK